VDVAGLYRTVVKQGADVGFVQDADADRLAVVNEKGEPLGEEMTLILASKHVLSKNPGAVVVNLSTSQAMDDLAREFKVPIFRTRIGEINVVEKILALEGKTAIAGEGNGGVILPCIHPCRDSFTAMGLILEFMASAGKRVSKLQEQVPKYYMIKDRIDGTQEEAFGIIRQLKKKYSSQDISLLDGLKIQFKDSWFHIRPSNTEPIIRLLAEAKTQRQAENLLSQFKKEIATLP